MTHFHTGQSVRLTAAFLERSPEFAMVTRAKVLEDPGNGAVRLSWFNGGEEIGWFKASDIEAIETKGAGA